ncbi:protein bric-a-brac 2 isoform X5 [Ooceraea biroi]|uniref:protein bric-a-brac 2 isoform X5 n=1 Tax=Ooceraea biroi TaxID=2015173 RepID=UPI0009716E1A|nr:protein bric-a-brac 2 isoform X5 [Ooceraea biroi]
MAASSSSQSGEQQYSLRWNDFHSSILNSFRHLRDEEDFVDVTLACDNNRSFTAHKVVLSACSPYFRKLLKANPCQHPIIILRDVPASDMESLLRFMYHGEVHVSQDQLGAFLKTAQLLHVRGLADVNCGVNAKIPLPSSSAGNNDSAPATPRNTWQDNGREDAGAQSPPEKRSRSYSPALSNHVEPSSKSDLQESLLGQALEGGPTIHTVSLNNVQAQSTCDSSLSEDEDISNNESILHSVKAEPNDMMNDMEHRNTFPAALLSLQGILSGAGPSGIHSNPTDSSYDHGLDEAEGAAYHHHHSHHQQHHRHRHHHPLSVPPPHHRHQASLEDDPPINQSSTTATMTIRTTSKYQRGQPDYRQQRLLREHHRQHGYRCPLCCRMLQDISTMRAHLDHHYPRDSPTCPVASCGKTFSHPNSVRNHMRLKHPVQWDQIKTLRWTYV